MQLNKNFEITLCVQVLVIRSLPKRKLQQLSGSYLIGRIADIFQRTQSKIKKRETLDIPIWKVINPMSAQI